MHLVHGLVERAAHVDALGVAFEVDRDHRLDLLVEPDLVEVDVHDPAAHRIELEILDQHRPALAVAVERDVEDRVQTAATAWRSARALTVMAWVSVVAEEMTPGISPAHGAPWRPSTPGRHEG